MAYRHVLQEGKTQDLKMVEWVFILFMFCAVISILYLQLNQLALLKKIIILITCVQPFLSKLSLQWDSLQKNGTVYIKLILLVFQE